MIEKPHSFSETAAADIEIAPRRAPFWWALAAVVPMLVAWQWTHAHQSLAPQNRSNTAKNPAEANAKIAHLSGAQPTPIVRKMPERPKFLDLPRWSQAEVVHKVPVRAGSKVFALTFDDGPWPVYTRKILRVLASRDVKATFFMVGQEVSRRSDVAREVLAAGHAIGNHSWDHPSRPRHPITQVLETDAEIKRALGFTPTLFRPPYGIVKNGMAKQAMREKDCVVLWSADSLDWRRAGVASIERRIVNQASSGGIALMHDGGGNRAETVAALPNIIDALRARGYQFVTVPELLALRFVAPKKKPAEKRNTKIAPHKGNITNAGKMPAAAAAVPLSATPTNAPAQP